MSFAVPSAYTHPIIHTAFENEILFYLPYKQPSGKESNGLGTYEEQQTLIYKPIFHGRKEEDPEDAEESVFWALCLTIFVRDGQIRRRRINRVN